MRDTNTVLLDVESYIHMVNEIIENKSKILDLQVDLKNLLVENKELIKELEKMMANRQMIVNT